MNLDKNQTEMRRDPRTDPRALKNLERGDEKESGNQEEKRR